MLPEWQAGSRTPVSRSKAETISALRFDKRVSVSSAWTILKSPAARAELPSPGSPLSRRTTRLAPSFARW